MFGAVRGGASAGGRSGFVTAENAAKYIKMGAFEVVTLFNCKECKEHKV